MDSAINATQSGTNADATQRDFLAFEEALDALLRSGGADELSAVHETFLASINERVIDRLVADVAPMAACAAADYAAVPGAATAKVAAVPDAATAKVAAQAVAAAYTWDSERDNRLALCMAQHARLGAASPARHLSSDLLRHIMQFVRPWLADWKLEISRMSVHQVRDGDYVLSSLRRFDVDVRLSSSAEALAQAAVQAHPAFAFEASIVHENGAPPPAAQRAEDYLCGDCDVLCTFDGAATALRLQLGIGLKRLGRGLTRGRFCLLIAPKDAALRARFPRLSVRSEPFRVVTKLRRPIPHHPAGPLPAYLAPAAHPPASLPLPT